MSLGLKVTLALVVVAALGAGFAAIVVGSRTFEGTVVPDPFEAASHFDEARHHAEALGWTLSLRPDALHTGTQVLRFSLSTRAGAPLEGAEARLRVSRPGTAWRDVSVEARREGPGQFAAEVSFPEPGIWDLAIRATRGADGLAFERRVDVAR